jgi:iron complex outermembrane recepter protein
MQLHRYLRLFLMLGFLLIMSLKAEPALAQPGPHDFNIPPQALASALKAYAQDTNLQLLYPSEIVQGLQSKGVVGQHTPQEALTILLQGSGLSFRFTDSNTVTVTKAENTSQQTPQSLKLEETQVTAVRERVQGYVAKTSTTAAKTDAPLIETPQSVSVIMRDQMEAQNVQSVPQALRYSAGVVAEQRGINTESLEYIYSRGFQIDEYLNGLRLPNVNAGFNIRSVDPYLLERIEILRGPASVLYGQALPGGLLNLVSKQPTPYPLHELVLQTGNYGRAQGAFDFSGPIDANSRLLYRLTGAAFDTDTQVDHHRQQKLSIAPALTWQPTDDTTLTLLTNYQYDPRAGFYNLMPARGMVLPNTVKIPRDFDPGDPSFHKYRKENYSVGYAFAHRFNAVWSVNQNFRYLNNDSFIRGVFADDGLLEDGTSLNRYAFFNTGNFSNILVDNQIHANFATGPLRHQTTVGLDYQRNHERHIFMANFSTPPISIVNPVYGQDIPFPDFLFGSSSKNRAHQLGFYAQDQIRLGNWAFLVGGRQDWFEEKSKSLKTFETTRQSDDAFTWRVGLVYLFDIGLAPYFSYSESFEPVLDTDFNGNPFKPTTGQQYEFGVKYQPPEFNSFITLSVFELTQQNVSTADPEHEFFSVQTGEIRSRGVELEGRLSLTNNLDVVAAYTYTDAENTESNSGNLHKTPTGIPRNMASLWGNYTIPIFPLNGLQIGAGVRYVDRTYGDATNSFKVPSYTLFDAALHYDFEQLQLPYLAGWEVTVTASNIFDKTYVSQCLGLNDCSYGLARRVLANLEYRW